jgi:DNA-binding MarR family transcriptional regulator
MASKSRSNRIRRTPERSADQLDADARELLTLLPPVFYGLRNAAPSAELVALVRDRALGGRHFPVLMIVIANEPLTVSQLAAKLHFSLATTSQLVSQLDRAGLLSRSQDPADRRRTIVSVAPATKPVIMAWYATRAAPLRRALEQLGSNERRSLKKGLGMLGAELAQEAQRASAADEA